MQRYLLFKIIQSFNHLLLRFIDVIKNLCASLNPKQKPILLAMRKTFLKYWHCLIALILLTTLSSSPVFAQVKEIKGVVKVQAGQTLPGAVIKVKGTTNGTATGTDGQFTIKAEQGDSLQISFMGYNTVTIAVTGSFINVTMLEEAINIADVVVIGYGSVKKSDLTGSVSTIKVEALQSIPANSIDGLLQGRSAGLQVINSSDDPAAGSTVRIRGGSSLYGSNSPLLVVDGFPLGEAGSLKQINPADIISVEVLKDASASAIYGSRGANGVIIVTTNRAKAGTTRINIKQQTTLSQFSSKLNIWRNMVLMAQLNNEDRINGGMVPLFTGTTYSNGVYYPSVEEIKSGAWPYYTEWDKVVFRDVPVSNNTTISINSANETTSFNLSANYFDQQGVYIKDGYSKGIINLGVTHKVFDFLTISTNNIISKGFRNYNGGLAYYRNPLWPVYDETGAYFLAGDTDYTHPLAITNLQTNKTNSMDFISSWQADVKFNKHLILKSQLNYKYGTYVNDQYYPKVYTELGVTNNGAAGIGNWLGQDVISETYLTYEKSFGRMHKLSAMIGHSYQTSMSRSSSLWAYDFVNEATGNENMASGDPEKNIVSNSYSKSELVSVLGRVNYTLLDKYLFTLTMRTDGSSKFGANNKYAFFPSGAVSWKAHQEDFISNMNIFDELKFRMSYGLSGNQGISPYQTLSQYGVEEYYSDGSWVTAIGPGYVSGYTGSDSRFRVWSGIPNEDLKWETTAQFDFGVDMAFLNGKIKSTFDYYVKNTSDLLRQTLLSLSSGYDVMWVNDGEIQNKGFELSLTGVLVDEKDADFSATIIYSRNRNKVMALGEETSAGLNTDPVTGMKYKFWGSTLSTFSQYPNILAIGKPVNVFYGYKVDGIIQSEEEGLAAGLSGDLAQPGEYKYVDVSQDGDFTDDDRTIIGDPNPDFLLSLALNGRYKNFDAEIFLNGVFGNDVIYTTQWGGQANTMPLRWTQDNPNNEYPSLRQSRTYYFSDWWVKDGSFLRIQNVDLGYNFKSEKVNWIKNLRLYVNASNLYTFTKFKGYDPEVGTDGIYWGGYPRLRRWTFGLDITF
jgi:TonB-dependent starch-binding outer membrane protein SusC